MILNPRDFDRWLDRASDLSHTPIDLLLPVPADETEAFKDEYRLNSK